MPMIDYLCDVCGYRFDNFFHSDAPSEQPCPHIECETGVAKKIFSLPGERIHANAQRFAPIVIWVNNDNPDQVSMPGRADEPVQDGYHAVEITNLSQADRWTRHMNNVALREAVNNRAAQKEYFEAMTKERRDNIRAKIGNNPRAKALFEKVCEYTDAKREKKYSKPMDPRGHFQVVAYDSSNRQGYADRETGWREKRS